MIETRNKLSIEQNSSTMSDLVFLLLVFFMMTSTLISPNAVKLLLPESGSKTMAKQNVTVYIDENHNFQVNNTPTDIDGLQPLIASASATPVLYCVPTSLSPFSMLSMSSMLSTPLTSKRVPNTR